MVGYKAEKKNCHYPEVIHLFYTELGYLYWTYIPNILLSNVVVE